MTMGDYAAGIFRLKFQALGTGCEVQFRAESVEGAKGYREAALGWLRGFEEKWSRFKPESLLCEINAAAGERAVEVGEDEVLKLCDHVYEISKGVIDASSHPLTRLWDEAGKRGLLPTDEEVEAARNLVNWSEVEWENGRVFLPEKGMALEIGGFGKEYAVDRLIGMAGEFGIVDCLVDLGRDVAGFGKPPQGEYWVVGVEDAREEEAVAFRLAFSGKALATSGNGRRYREIGGERFGHIIDLRSGRPAEREVLTASCLADDCLTAGVLSTKACVLGIGEGLAEIDRHLGVEAILQTQDQIYYSSNIHRYVLGS